MYEAFFQFRRRPFSASPDAKSYVAVGSIEQARVAVQRTIEHANGPAIVLGSPGTGKTLLCQVIAAQMKERFRVALLASGRLCTRRDLLQAILFELGLPYRDMEESELRLSLVDYLTFSERCPHGMLLLVDEAHTMPLRLLEEVRMITNLVRDGQARVRVVLAGGPQLEERFASPKLESFNQRIAARCYLETLRRGETSHYINMLIGQAGGDAGRIFPEDAMRAVYDATGGIPRLINQLCDHALILSALGHHRTVTHEIVQEAWADLQQLPTPWLEAEISGGQTSSVIEFGSLEEDDSTGPASIPFPARRDGAHVEHKRSGTESMSLEDEAEQRLNQIERQVAVASAFDLTNDELWQETEELYSALPEPRRTETRRPESAPRVTQPQAKHPFGESFDEEETVVDVYAALDVQSFNAPRVSSSEGKKIGAWLKQLNEQAETPCRTAGSCDRPTTTAPENEMTLVEVDVVLPPTDERAELAEARRQQFELTHAVAQLLSEQLGELEETEEWTHEAAFDSSDEVTLMHTPAEEIAEVDIEDDRDMIIIDDHPHDEDQPLPKPHQGHARRQQYRQLFARLRRG